MISLRIISATGIKLLSSCKPLRISRPLALVAETHWARVCAVPTASIKTEDAGTVGCVAHSLDRIDRARLKRDAAKRLRPSPAAPRRSRR